MIAKMPFLIRTRQLYIVVLNYNSQAALVKY